MPAPTEDLLARRPVWDALSSMFLDTDVAATRPWRCAVLVSSPYSLAELEQILIDEVYPVCWSRLQADTGHDAGFDLAWLEARILEQDAASEPYRRLQDLARLSVPRSREWLATKAAVESMRGTGSAGTR